MKSTLATVDMSCRDNYSDSFSSLPRGRCLGSVPFDASDWHPTLEQERAVEAYLSSKSGEDQLALARLIRDVEVGPPRSKTTTLEAPWLQKPGYAQSVAAEWSRKLGIAS